MWPEVPPFRTKTIRLLEGDLFTFTVDAGGMYVDWPNLYCLIAIRPTGLSLRAMANRMAAVCQFHNWAAGAGIDVRARVQGLSFFLTSEVEALKREMRVNLLTRPLKQRRGGRPPARRDTVTNTQWLTRCAAVRDYVTFHAEEAIQRMASDDSRLPEARARLEDFRKWMSVDAKSEGPGDREGLSPEARAVFLRAITPGDASNPFAARHQHRNYALWLTYFTGGIRRSEGLGLKGEDLRLHGADPKVIVHRRPDDPDEVRTVQPNTKTRPHPVMIDRELCDALHDYMVKHRPKLRGAKKSPYVFFGQMGKPLSVASIHYMCALLRTVHGMPADFTTHVLRYDWNDRFGEGAEKVGLDGDHEKQVRNLHQGWTPDLEQGVEYGRGRNRKRAHEISLAMQDEATKGAA